MKNYLILNCFNVILFFNKRKKTKLIACTCIKRTQYEPSNMFDNRVSHNKNFVKCETLSNCMCVILLMRFSQYSEISTNDNKNLLEYSR